MSMRSVICSVAHYVPERVVTNHDLAGSMDTSDAWIQERTGIQERRFVDSETTASDLGYRAAVKAIAQAGIDADSIDLVIAATLSPDHYFPGIGCMIQHRLGMPHTPALDIRAQCSGLVYGLSCADAYLRSGQARTVLLICSEVQSTRLNYTNEGRDMAVLFGDGAGALVLEADSSGDRGIIDSILHSDGSGAEVLMLRNPENWEFRLPHPEGKTVNGWHPQMDGRQVFKNAVARMGEAAEEIMARNGRSAADLKLVFPHQANLRINEAVRDRLGLKPEQVFNNIQRYGNTTAATIPIAMSEANAAGMLERGDLVLTLAFGAGFTWGANLLVW